jgi:hypothetical protein
MRCRLGWISLECALGVMLVSLPAIARAQSSGQAIEGGAPRDVSLRVTVRASVAASCAFTTGNVPSGTYSVGNVEGAFSIDVGFSLRCNSPSRVGIVSDNGGLQAPGVPIVPPGYARLAPYQITLRLAGEQSMVQASCQSPTVTSGAPGCIFRGPATAANGLRLPEASWDAPGSFIRISSQGYTGSGILVASNSYSDRLTVTISPAT